MPIKSSTENNWTADELWSVLQSDPGWNDWQEGRITPRDWYAYLMRRLHLSLDFDEFCAAWCSILEPQTILSDQLFTQLGARCRLGLLSNTDPIHVAYIERHFDFLRHFPARIYSCSVGASKPSPAIYQAALRAVGVSAAEALYIDDIEEFAEAARQLGLDAIHFEDPAQLARELSSRGLPSEP